MPVSGGTRSGRAGSGGSTAWQLKNDRLELINLWGSGLPWIGVVALAGWFAAVLSVGDHRPFGMLTVSLAWFAGVSFILSGLLAKACAETWFFSRRNSLWGKNPIKIADVMLNRVTDVKGNWERHTLRSFLETASWMHALLRLHNVAVAAGLDPLTSIVVAVSAGTFVGASCVLLGEHWTATAREAEVFMLWDWMTEPKTKVRARSESFSASSVANGAAEAACGGGSGGDAASKKSPGGTAPHEASGAAQAVAAAVALALSGTLVHLRDTQDLGLALLLTAFSNVAFITCGQLFMQVKPTRWVGTVLQNRWTNAARNWERRPVRSGLETSFYLGATTHSYVLFGDVLAAALLGTLCGIVICLASEWMLSFAPCGFDVTDASSSSDDEEASPLCGGAEEEEKDDDEDAPPTATPAESKRTFARFAMAWAGAVTLYASHAHTESPELALLLTMTAGVALLWLTPFVCGTLLDDSCILRGRGKDEQGDQVRYGANDPPPITPLLRWSAAQIGRRFVDVPVPTVSGVGRYLRSHGVLFHLASLTEIAVWLLAVVALHAASSSSWLIASQLGTLLTACAILTGEYLQIHPVQQIHATLFPLSGRDKRVVTVDAALRHVAALGTDRHETSVASKRRLLGGGATMSAPLLTWAEVRAMDGSLVAAGEGPSWDLREQVPTATHRPSWVVVEDGVYDVTGWAADHPGGAGVLAKFAGADATDQFAAFHRPAVARTLRKYLVGRVEQGGGGGGSAVAKPAPHAVTVEYRAVRRYLWDHGFFETGETDAATWSYFVNKHLVVLAFVLLSLFVLLALVPGPLLAVAQQAAEAVEGAGAGASAVALPPALYDVCTRIFGRLCLSAVAGVALGIAWQQVGFLAHDSLHNGVYRSSAFSASSSPPGGRRGGGLSFWRSKHRALGWLHASVMFGISGAMWLDEHSVHHAVTMRPMEDPQFNYLPLWLISKKEVLWKKYKLGRLERAFISVQHYTFLPLAILVGRFNLYLISIFYAAKTAEIMDLAGITVFWFWFTSLLGLIPSSADLAPELDALWAHSAAVGDGAGEEGGQGGCGAAAALCAALLRYVLVPALTCLGPRTVFVLASHWTAGLLHVQLLVNHLATDSFTTEEERDLQFFSFQVRTTRNITASRETEWLHGGLHDQYEHHLFPQLPRHRIAEVRAVVRELCARHGLEYESLPFEVALRECLAEFKSLAFEVASGHLD